MSKSNGKSLDKKKALPQKKFPELKLMINGEYRNGNNTLSSDDDMNLAVSFCECLTVIFAVPPYQENSGDQRLAAPTHKLPAAVAEHVSLQCGAYLEYGRHHK